MKMTWQIKLSETPARGKLLEKAAAKNGQKVHDWIREVLSRAAKRALGLGDKREE